MCMFSIVVTMAFDTNSIWALVEGDAVIAPGVSVVLIGGHNNGHQSVEGKGGPAGGHSPCQRRFSP